MLQGKEQRRCSKGGEVEVNELERDRAPGAPCQRACPAGIDVPRYNRLISSGRFDEALAVIREKIPFPSICGLVCFAPCETQCRLGEIDSPVRIRALKRFVVEKAGAVPEARAAPATGRSIAVVGSGPAGLTASYYLAKQGHSVTMFETLPELGGMTRYGIPEYRLPKEALEREIDTVRRMNVTMRTNTRVDSTDALLADGYDAVLVAIGAHRGVRLGIEGEEMPEVIDCLSFLRGVNTGTRYELGNNVVVVGGGNSAVDSARVARRLGGEEVTIVYRRSQEEMPANPSEVEEAIREGVSIQFLVVPVEIKGHRGSLEIHCMRTKLGEVDASGRRRPEPVPGSDFSISADTVIVAVGEVPEFADQLGLPITEQGTVQVNPDTLSTDKPGVFACGDVVSGAASVIDAIASGRKAAISIDKYLGGEGNISETLAPPEEAVVEQVPLSLSIDRALIPSLAIAERLPSFAPVESCLTEEAAVAEAKRCLWCDFEIAIEAAKCAHCITCELVCSFAFTQTFNPLQAYIETSTPQGPQFKDDCIHCNLCARYCAHGGLSLIKEPGR